MTDEIAANEPLDTDDADLHPPTPAVQDLSALALIFVGGMVGTALRYLIGNAIPPVDGLRVGIFTINVLGAFLIGVLIESLALRGDDTGRRRQLRLLLATGVLGGFTTYSALAVDTASLLETGSIAASLGYGMTTVVLGGVATWLGILLARAVGRSQVDAMADVR